MQLKETLFGPGPFNSLSTKKLYLILSFIMLFLTTGCKSQFDINSDPAASMLRDDRRSFLSKEEFLDYLMDGYVEGTENLYYTSYMLKPIRLEKLHKALGFDSCDTIRTANCGKSLVFQVRKDYSGDEEVMVLSSDAPPRMSTASEFWYGDCRVYRETKSRGKHCLHPMNGAKFHPAIGCGFGVSTKDGDKIVFENGFLVDDDIYGWMDEQQEFFCYGQKIDKTGFKITNSPLVENIKIISVDNPEISVHSCLKYLPDSMVISNGRLILTAETHKRSLPVFHIEIFDIVDGKLEYVKDYYADPPFGGPLVLRGEVEDYDFLTNSQIFAIYRSFPFVSAQYIYNYDDNTFKKLPPSRGKVKYINPEILRNAIKYINLEKLNEVSKEGYSGKIYHSGG